MKDLFVQRVVLVIGLLTLLIGYLGFFLLADLSRQFFRQDVGRWRTFSIGLAVFGIGLVVAWFLGRVFSGGGGKGEQPDEAAP